MGFQDLVQRVRERELALEQRHAEASASWQGLRGRWRAGWTPTRIVLGGLLGGFVIGWARPVRRVTGLPASRWVQIATSLWSMTASFRAKEAATHAEAAAGEAGVAAEVAAETADVAAAATGVPGTAHVAPASGAEPTAAAAPARPLPSDAPRRVEAGWETAPRPAEAATEVSER